MTKYSKLIESMNCLIRMEQAAALAYARALEGIDYPETRDTLLGFLADQERHIHDLSREVVALGGRAPTGTPEPITTLRRKEGIEETLRAMQTNEERTNRSYEAALREDFPTRLRAIVLRNLDDEQIHLRYLQRTLRERPWLDDQRRAG
jgi:rubrerythrin